MFFDRQTSRRTISSLQQQYQSRLENPFYRTLARHFETYPHTRPRTPEHRELSCQFIEGSPTKADYRKFGSQHFMCGDAVMGESPYCPYHHRVAYVPKPAKTAAE